MLSWRFRIWTVKLPFCANDLKHIWHECGLSPVCIRLCTLRAAFEAAARPHTSHIWFSGDRIPSIAESLARWFINWNHNRRVLVFGNLHEYLLKKIHIRLGKFSRPIFMYILKKTPGTELKKIPVAAIRVSWKSEVLVLDNAVCCTGMPIHIPTLTECFVAHRTNVGFVSRMGPHVYNQRGFGSGYKTTNSTWKSVRYRV